MNGPAGRPGRVLSAYESGRIINIFVIVIDIDCSLYPHGGMCSFTWTGRNTAGLSTRFGHEWLRAVHKWRITPLIWHTFKWCILPFSCILRAPALSRPKAIILYCWLLLPPPRRLCFQRRLFVCLFVLLYQDYAKSNRLIFRKFDGRVVNNTFKEYWQ